MLSSVEEQPKSQGIPVTGAASFIGSQLTDALVNRGCKVMTLDSMSFGTQKNIVLHLSNGQARSVKGDMRNIRDVKEALDDVDLAFQLADFTSVPY